MADNEALQFEGGEDDNEATRIGLASLREFNEEIAMDEINRTRDFDAINKLSKMTNNNNKKNELEALRTLVYVRSKGHIYVELRDDIRASTPPHERRWGKFYCILCRIGMYGRCELYRHLMDITHQQKLQVARLTLLSPGAFPYNDGIELFQYDSLNIEEDIDVGTLLCNLPHCWARDVNDVPARFPSYRRAILISNHDLRAVFDWCFTMTARVSVTMPQEISSIICYSEVNSVRVIGAEAEYTEYDVLTLNRTDNLDQECGLCTHLMKGPHVSTLMRTADRRQHVYTLTRPGTLICSQQEFHIFHTSCLIRWILWREYTFLTKFPPEVRNIHRMMKTPLVCPTCPPTIDILQRQQIREAHIDWQNQVLADEVALPNCSTGLRFSHPQEPQQDLPLKLVRCYRAGNEWH